MNLSLLVAVPALAVAAIAQGESPARSAEAILRDFDRVAMPSFSDGSDPESVRRFKQAIDDGCARQAELAAELQRAHPDHPRLPDVLSTRWAGMTNARGLADEVATEVGALLQQESPRQDVRSEALLARSRAMLLSAKFTDLERLDAVRATLAIEGQDDRVANDFIDFVERHVVDPAAQRTLLEIVAKRWPDSAYGGRTAKRWLHVLGMIGKPFREQLPESLRPWFDAETKEPRDVTVVHFWMGWASIDDPEDDVAAMKSLRQELGQRVRLLGLINGDAKERLPALRDAGVDWPQTELRDEQPMTTPFGAPRSGLCFVLDRAGIVVGITGRAFTVKKRIDQLEALATAR
jgi:hypothetical protein